MSQQKIETVENNFDTSLIKLTINKESKLLVLSIFDREDNDSYHSLYLHNFATKENLNKLSKAFSNLANQF